MTGSIYKIVILSCILFNVIYAQHNSESRRAKIARVGDKSKEKCREYGLYVFDNPADKSSDQECVGVHFQYYPPKDHLAQPKEFPHMAAIGYDDQNNQKVWRCSGSLISDQFVLTAAKCLNIDGYGAPKYVRIGDLDLDSEDDDAKPQNFQVLETFAHPDYKPPSLYNDIALVKLDKVVQLNPYARPACLPTKTTIQSTAILSSAWTKNNSCLEFGPNLLKAQVKLFSNNDCNQSYKNLIGDALTNGIVDEMQVCAGPEALSDVCLLGAGRPLVIFNADVFCTFKVLGVKSFGQTCGDSNVPEVFTRVSAYVEWIERIVWP